MYCKHCGKEIDEGYAYCSNCGGRVNDTFHADHIKQEKTENNVESPKRPEAPVTFEKAINNYFTKMFDYNGRSVRSEYWWIWLLNFPIGLLFSLLLHGSHDDVLTHYIWVTYIAYSIVSLLAGTSLIVRRLHDIGKSGYWAFTGLIPFIGSFILFSFLVQDSVGDNEWGLSYHCTTETKKDNPDKYNDVYEKALNMAEHKWRCECGNMIFTIPCPFCGREEDNRVKQNKEIKIEEGFKKCCGCGAIVPSYAKKCVCGCKSFQDHI